MRFLFLILLSVCCMACSKSDDSNNDNPYLPNYSFDTGGLINTNLPQYSSLKLAGNHVVINNPYGIRGTVIYYSGTTYSAFEISDPNHHLNDCSTLTINGITATCSCNDENTYNIVTGTPFDGTAGQHGLKPYFVEVNGNIIRVYNN